MAMKSFGLLRNLVPTLFASILACHAVPAGAQDDIAASLPDPATIKVPDVAPSNDPKVIGDGYKFYYFHNPIPGTPPEGDKCWSISALIPFLPLRYP